MYYCLADNSTLFFNAAKRRRTFTNLKLLSFFSKKKHIKRQFTNPLTLKFGDASFINLNPLVLTNLFIIKFILFLKRVVKKRGKSFRFFYFRPVKCVKISKQSKGARMGKGKGKSVINVQRLKPAANLVEFSGVRWGRLLYYRRLLSNRLPTPILAYSGPFHHLYTSTSSNPSSLFNRLSRDWKLIK